LPPATVQSSSRLIFLSVRFRAHGFGRNAPFPWAFLPFRSLSPPFSPHLVQKHLRVFAPLLFHISYSLCVLMEVSQGVHGAREIHFSCLKFHFAPQLVVSCEQLSLTQTPRAPVLSSPLSSLLWPHLRLPAYKTKIFGPLPPELFPCARDWTSSPCCHSCDSFNPPSFVFPLKKPPQNSLRTHL